MRHQTVGILLLLGLALSASSAAFAQTYSYGSWHLTFGGGDQQAYTTNASGSTVGVLCFTQNSSCLAYFRTAVNCENGVSIPMLVSSAVGAVAANSKCVKLTDANGQTLELNQIDLNLFKSVAESGSEFGIVVPLVGGQFSVMRFSSEGATAAITGAMTLPPATRKAPADHVL